MASIREFIILSFLFLICSSFKVAFLLPGSVSDFGFNYQIFLGIQDLQKDFPQIQTAYTPSVAVADCLSTVATYLNSGFDMIFFPNLGFTSCATTTAINNPTKFFVLQSTGGNPTNIPNLAFKFGLGQNEAKFIAGVLASKQKQSSKICLMIPKIYPFKQTIANSILLGMRHVSNTDELHMGMTLSFNDANTETIVANHFIQYGCDTTILHGVNSVLSVEILANASKWSIGFASDMRDFVGESVLSSVVENWNIMFSYYVQKAMAGTFISELFIVNLQNRGISFADYSCEVTKSARTNTNSVENRVIAGTLNPFCEPLVQETFGSPCVNETVMGSLYMSGITIFDGTI